MNIQGIVKLNHLIDHTLLKPESVYGNFTDLCREALQYQFYSVCVNSFYVGLVSTRLRQFAHNEVVKVASVIGFPFGASTIQSKIEEIKSVINVGVDELDLVVNIGALKSGGHHRVKDELKVLRQVSGNKVLKVILETGLLTEDEIKRGCELCIETGCDFVKTSTGFNKKNTFEETFKHVQLLKEFTKGSSIKVKASSGIRTLEDAQKLLTLGVDRIGTSFGVMIMEQLLEEKRK